MFCRFDNICGTWNKLIYTLHALHTPFAWAACDVAERKHTLSPDQTVRDSR